MSELLTAKKDIMQFRFELLHKSENEIEIVMYNSVYKLVKEADKWSNAVGNKMRMSSELINAVIEAVYPTTA